MKNCWSAVDIWGEGWSMNTLRLLENSRICEWKENSKKKTQSGKWEKLEKWDWTLLLHIATWHFTLILPFKDSLATDVDGGAVDSYSQKRTRLSNILTVLSATDKVRRERISLAKNGKTWNLVIEFAIKWCERRKINQVESKSKQKKKGKVMNF